MTDKNTLFEEKTTLNLQGNLLDLSTPVVMGILNLTPDSFYQPEGRNGQPGIAQIIKEAEKMLEEGAKIIDLGAYSSRPNATHISANEESQRLIPVLKALTTSLPEAIISVDTFRAEIAEQAVQEGAHIINDISAGELDEKMFETVARLKVPYILMHMQGTPQTMQQHPHYENIIGEIIEYFDKKIQKLHDLGAYDLIIDPGFGFGKTLEHNYELMDKLNTLQILGLPILAGVSRKSMIYKLLGSTAKEALNGTTVLHTLALQKGAKILRVHDVKPAMEVVKIMAKLNAV